MAKDKYRDGRYAEARDTAEVTDDAEVVGMDRRELIKYLTESNKKLARQERQLAALAEQRRSEPDKIELIIDCLSAEKRIVDELSDNMVATVDTGDMRIANEIKTRMMPHLKRYNSLVEEYRAKTGGALTPASYSIPDDIIAKREYAVLPLLTYTTQPADDEYDDGSSTHSVAIMSAKEFAKYTAESERAMAPVRSKLENTVKKMSASDGQEKAILILTALSLEKQLIDSDIELVGASVKSTSPRDVQDAKRRLNADAKEYNSLVDEYEKLTGGKLTRASETLAQDVAAGREYDLLPTISYTVNDTANGDTEEEKYKNAKKNIQNAADNEKKVALTALEAKINEQANKDLSVLTKHADFKVSMLESERDIARYRFGMAPKASKKRKKEIEKEIAAIKRTHREALRYEESDNKRYYAVVKNDPDTMKVAKKRADRDKIASLRGRMIALLNQRDEINGKLMSIYTGSEINNDGSSVNQAWRRIKNEAAERAVKKDKKLAKKVARLPATPAEKQSIYNIMNKKLDAVSTLALCEHRLRKEKLSRAEARELREDIARQRKIMKQCDSDVNWRAEQIKKRGAKKGGAGWVVGFIVILLLVLGAGAAFLWFFGQDLLSGLGL